MDKLAAVAPRGEQPVQAAEWPGHASAKFGGVRRPLPHPEVNPDAPHPLYAMGGRTHYDA